MVPVQKKDGRWRVCVDFRDLNRATRKDEYPMPVAEILINAAAGHKMMSFMGGNCDTLGVCTVVVYLLYASCA